MSENAPAGNDLTTEFAKELAKQLPVKDIYQDAASPAFRQAGQMLSDITKVIHLALAPVQFLAAYQDRLRNFIDTSVRRVPEDRRVAPAPQILGPIVEGIRYEPVDTPIDAMFSELLSRSMDREHLHEAHPSYPIIIKQLSGDEAKILKRLDGNTFEFVYTFDFNAKRQEFVGDRKVEVDNFPRDGLIYPENIPFYFEHVNQLGLAGIFQVGNQEPLFEDKPPSDRTQIGTRSHSQYRLTDFGQRFIRACGGDKT